MKKFILALSTFLSVQACPHHPYVVHYEDQQGKAHSVSVSPCVGYHCIGDHPLLVKLLVKDYGAVRSTIRKGDEDEECEKPTITQESLEKIAPLNEESNLWIYRREQGGRCMTHVGRDLPYWEPEVKKEMMNCLLFCYEDIALNENASENAKNYAKKNIKSIKSTMLFVERLPRHVMDLERGPGIIEDPANLLNEFRLKEERDYIYFSEYGECVDRAFVGIKGQDNSKKRERVKENIIKYFNFVKEEKVQKKLKTLRVRKSVAVEPQEVREE